MSAVFLKLLNLSIAAGWLILAVVLLRPLLKKAPKNAVCVLWALVAVRLICPFSLKSAWSLIPSEETVNMTNFTARPYIQSGINVIDRAANGYLGDHYFEGVTVASRGSLSNPLTALTLIWIIGVFALSVYALISYLRLKRSIAASVPVSDGIFVCDEVRSPFILGIIRPAIYVPSSLDKETLHSVVIHERAHIRRRDHWWKPLGYLLLTIYWFHPLIWLAYILLCRDIELACDEKVIRGMSREDKAAYSQALLRCSFPRRTVAVCPLAFGEVGVKDRVRNVLNYKKPTFWIVIAAILLCIVCAVCFLTDPAEPAAPDVPSEPAVQPGEVPAKPIATEENDPETLPQIKVFVWPCDNPEVTSPFGERIHPVSGETIRHDHIDIKGELRDPVYAAAAGTVDAVGYDAQIGNYIAIDCGDGIVTKYMMLSEAAVEEGDPVEAGSVIGAVGSTGLSTGPHLGFFVSQNGEAVDPMIFYTASSSVILTKQDGESKEALN